MLASGQRVLPITLTGIVFVSSSCRLRKGVVEGAYVCLWPATRNQTGYIGAGRVIFGHLMHVARHMQRSPAVL
jgi:hypothetical protein